MAVAASSAFPGFFPPLELCGYDVGADAGEFHHQAFTDGGVYDNLGLRMFRCIEQSWVRDAAPLRREDFLELEAVTAALMSATNLPEQTPLRRLRELLASFDPKHLALDQAEPRADTARAIVDGLREVTKSEELFRDASFRGIELADPTAQSLFGYVVESGREPDLDDRLWLNRHIVESALRQVIGKPCLRLSQKEFDGILVSDAGGKFKVTRDIRTSGLINTALRSSDILMDRVWQQELETFENAPGVLFFPITDVVQRSQDKFAPDPEIQRQASRIRTDLDRFSELEISALVQHGYCVARKACRRQAEHFKSDIPTGAPWDPVVADDAGHKPEHGDSPSHEQDKALRTSRRLRRSSMRRVWSTLLSLRDWPTYVWLPLVVCVVVSLPYTILKLREHARQQNMVLTAIAETSPVYDKILSLLEHGPASLEKMPYADVKSLPEPDFTGFEFLSDTRIYDLRGWTDSEDSTPAAAYSRLRLRRTAEGKENTHLRIQRQMMEDDLSMFCRTQRLQPTLSRMQRPDDRYVWELGLDFSRVPINSDVEVVMEAELGEEVAQQMANEGRFNFTVYTETGLVQVWMLLPKDRSFESFQVSGYPIDQPELAQIVAPHSTVQLPFGSIATFRLINPDADFRYECSWTWSDKVTSSSLQTSP
jgi:hypothetical protein